MEASLILYGACDMIRFSNVGMTYSGLIFTSTTYRHAIFIIL